MKRSLVIIVLVLLVASVGSAYPSSVIQDPPYPPKEITYSGSAKTVTGWVKLNVEFRADGTIGAVEFLEESTKKMTELGLVDEAIKAAKQIKFTPYSRDGKPVGIRKTLLVHFRQN